MGVTDESKITSNEMENLSVQTDRFPRDLLQRFMVSTSRRSELDAGKDEGEEDGSGEIELNLGLSLGGRFGVDKTNNKLMRSSSIAGYIPLVRDDDALNPPQVSSPGLVRTSSLPVETEEEWRKRKELQSLRRMAAKRRRSEKQRNLRSEKEERRNEREEYVAAMNRVGSSTGPPFGFHTWAAKQAIRGGGVDSGGGSAFGSGGFVQPSSQGSAESQGGSCSSLSELESRPVQGASSGGEASPVSMQSLQERSNQDALGSSGPKTSAPSGAEMENPSKNRGKEIGLNSVEDMPCVFTKVDGPNGRRIEGILYKYGKGEEVKIMCVCHGSFYSPAEFVKHAGGTDVAHPLKHIVVNPNSSSFL